MRFPHFASASLVLCALAPLTAFAQPAAGAGGTPPAGSAPAEVGDTTPSVTVVNGLIIHHTPVDPPDESNVDYFWRKSDEAFHSGDYPRAIQLHRAIVVLDPADVDSYGVGAWLLWSMGKTQDADAFLAEGLKANPKDSDMWDTAAQQYDLEKEVAAAEDGYAKAVGFADPKLSNDNSMLRRRYAHALEHNGHLPQAQGVWEALVKDYPTDPVIAHNLDRVRREIAAGATRTDALGSGATGAPPVPAPAPVTTTQ